jgi:hypothetical protein
VVGKINHSEAEDILKAGDDYVKEIVGAAIAGKASGAATTAGVAAILRRGDKALNRLLVGKRHSDSRSDADPGNNIQLSEGDRAALFDLALLGYGQMMSDRTSKSDAFPTYIHKDAFNPRQPRDKNGRWVKGSGGSKSGKVIANLPYGMKLESPLAGETN